MQLPFDSRLDPNNLEGPVGTKLTIPTHDSPNGGQVVHPSVLYFPEKWNGFHYWMAITPYPEGNDDFEDPNILASNDASVWVVPAGLTNPLDDASGQPAYNSDTNLALGPDDMLYCFWRFYDQNAAGAQERIYMRKTADGVNWTPKQLVHSMDQADMRLVAPAFIYENNGWTMYGVNIVPAKNVIMRLRSEGDSLAPSSWSRKSCTVTPATPADRDPWHLSMRKVGAQYVSVLNESANGSAALGDLKILVSEDGLNFKASSSPIIPRVREGSFPHNELYMASFVPMFRNGVLGLEVWYSAQKSPESIWNLYRTWVGPKTIGQGQKVISGTYNIKRLDPNAQDNVPISFPEGFFTSPPRLIANAESTRINTGTYNISASGATILNGNISGGIYPDGKGHWIAVGN